MKTAIAAAKGMEEYGVYWLEEPLDAYDYDGLGLVANLHCAAASANVPYVEFPYDPPNWTPAERDFIFREPINIDSEGYVHLPQGPGLGVELDEERLAPYERKRLESR